MKKNLLCIVALLLASPLAHAIPTENGGQPYIDECRAAGVPIPPDWPTPTKWIRRGALDRPLNPHDPNSPRTFISQDKYAEVYYYDSRVDPGQPQGVCIALPRFDETARNQPTNNINLLGIICQGKATGAACFWDNTKNRVRFDIGRSEFVPIVAPPGAPAGTKSFSGGFDLLNASGGACTTCHAGENIFIIHPEVSAIDPTPLALGDALLKPDLWPTPLVPRAWPDNPGPGDPLAGVASAKSCANCHGPGGHRFPQLSRELSGYCASLAAQGELESAIAYTMPAFQILGNPSQIFVPAAQDPGFNNHLAALRAACQSDPPLAVEEIMMIMD